MRLAKGRARLDRSYLIYFIESMLHYMVLIVDLLGVWYLYKLFMFDEMGRLVS